MTLRSLEQKSKNKDSNRVYWFYLWTILLSIPLGLFLEFFKAILLSGLDSTTFAGSLAVSILTALGFGSSFFKLIYFVFVFR